MLRGVQSSIPGPVKKSPVALPNSREMICDKHDANLGYRHYKPTILRIEQILTKVLGRG